METIKEAATFLSLPAEIRNRIYSLSGCLQFWEDPKMVIFRATVPGDYCPALHKQVHGCPRSAQCPHWDDSHILNESWKPALTIINPSNPCSRSAASYLGFHSILPEGTPCHPNRQADRFTRPIYRNPLKCHLATGVQPALTRVSRQIRQDTLPIFYGNHPFVFRIVDEEGNSTNQVKSWLRAIGPSNAASLRDIRIVCFHTKVFLAINELLKELAALGVKTGRGFIRVLLFKKTKDTEYQRVMPDWQILRLLRAREKGGLVNTTTESVH